jgi:hypothetical protein
MTPSRYHASVQAERRYRTLLSITWSDFKRMLDSGVAPAALIWPELPARAKVVFSGHIFGFAREEHDSEAALPSSSLRTMKRTTQPISLRGPPRSAALPSGTAARPCSEWRTSTLRA